MSKYVASGYWAKGYAEGDYLNAAASSDVASATNAGAGLVLPAALASAAASSTTLSPYRVQQAGIQAAAVSVTNAGAGMNHAGAALIAAEGNLLVSTVRIITKSGAKSAATGVMAISGRLKWESEPEPGDTWTDRVEPSAIWADKPEPGDTWSNV